MIVYENVKEIILETRYVFNSFNPGWYTDRLKITNNSISYSRVNFHDENMKLNWRHSIKSELFTSRYYHLIEELDKELESDMSRHVMITDCGRFKIMIKTIDKETHIIKGSSSLQYNGLYDIASAFLSLIPFGEDYPDFINLNPIDIGINKYVSKAVKVFEKMKPYEETSVMDLLRQVNYPDNITFEEFDQFKALCDRKHIQMKYPFYDLIVGMPWVIDFHR